MKSKMIFCQTDETMLLPLYATTIGYWEHQAETLRPAGFPDYQMHQVLEGKGELNINDKSYIVGPGEVFFYILKFRISILRLAGSGGWRGFHLAAGKLPRC